MAQLDALGGDRGGVFSFFYRTWAEGPYHYRVYLTRRCFNLNELFFYCCYLADVNRADAMAEEIGFPGSWKDVCGARETFITQNALLSYVDDLVAGYLDTGVFPKILLVDELVIYGREISAFLQTLESAVLHLWQERSGKLDEGSARKVRSDLLQAVDVRAYACGDQLLLGARYRAHLQCDVKMPYSKWRGFTQLVSYWITESSLVENTSYAPFFRLDGAQYQKLADSLLRLHWHRRQWVYHRLRAEIWQLSVPSFDGGSRLIWTLRVHRDEETSGDTVRLTPYALFNSLSAEGLDALSREIAAYLRDLEEPDGRYDYMADVLESDCNLMRGVHAQMISFLMSVALFFQITEQAGIVFTPYPDPDSESDVGFTWKKNHDLDKIAQNFGKRKDIYPAFVSLCAPEAGVRRKAIWEIIWKRLVRDLKPLRTERLFGTKICEEASVYLEEAENYFLQVGLRDEKRLNDVRERGLTYSSDIRSNIYASLEEYLDYFAEGASGGKNCLYGAENCVGALLMLMDQGVTSMIVHGGGSPETFSDENFVRSWVRAGEKSLYVELQRYYRFLPALIRLEARCRRLGYSVSEQAERFGRCLEEDEPGQGLDKGFFRLTREIYSRRQKLREWDFDFLLTLDQPVRYENERARDSVRPRKEWGDRDWGSEWELFQKMDEKGYIAYERSKQKYYEDKAESFCLV